MLSDTMQTFECPNFGVSMLLELPDFQLEIKMRMPITNFAGFASNTMMELSRISFQEIRIGKAAKGLILINFLSQYQNLK